MSDGSEFQACGAATENARRENSIRVLVVDSSGRSNGVPFPASAEVFCTTYR